MKCGHYGSPLLIHEPVKILTKERSYHLKRSLEVVSVFSNVVVNHDDWINVIVVSLFNSSSHRKMEIETLFELIEEMSVIFKTRLKGSTKEMNQEKRRLCIQSASTNAFFLSVEDNREELIAQFLI